ncbi:MAG: hypothetical protein QW282_05150 [Nitrososphaerales archaeon]
MKVVMLHDCAYIASTLAKHLARIGVEVDKLPLQTIPKTVRALRSCKADLIHAHYARAPAWAAMLSGKRYVVHCHGDDIRHGYSVLTKLAFKRAALILHATPDLEGVVKGSIYLPNPVDKERFKAKRVIREVNTAIYFTHPEAHPNTRGREEDIVKRLQTFCAEAEVKLNIVAKGSVKYEAMPTLLSNYDLFLDHWMVPAYSKTALEAMSMHIPVIGYETPLEHLKQKLIEAKTDPQPLIERGKRIVEEHDPDKVAQLLYKLYQKAVNTMC